MSASTGGRAIPAADGARRSRWYALTEDHGVLEFRPATGTVLALHVLLGSDGDATVAWWELEREMWVAQVGST